MSLAILPSSPATYSQPPLLASAPSPSKRPKLSLNTTILPPAFGKKTTSLRLETLSATSPTIRNTFSNAHEEDSGLKAPGSRPKRPTLSTLSTSNIPTHDAPSTSPTAQDHLDASSTSSTSTSSTTSAISTSTIDSLPPPVPYKLTYNLPSILSNSPLSRPATQRKKPTKPMFPAAKKVAFRAPLTEDIKTEKYTLRHSDIDSSMSTISTLELSPPSPDKEPSQPAEQSSSSSPARKPEDKPAADQKQESYAPKPKPKRSSPPRAGDKRDSSDEEDDSDACPATPVAGRKKRHREWVWTLGPIGGEKAAEGKEEEDREDSVVGR